MIKTLGKMRFFFVRGHSVYLSYPFSVLNFTLIAYNFMVKKWSFIPEQYNNFYIFAVAFIALFIPACILFGYIDCKRGFYISEQEKDIDINPAWIKLYKKLDDIEKHIKVRR